MEEERIFFEAKEARIEGLLSLDKEPTRGSVIICHPHPLFGGNMYKDIALDDDDFF
jgi:alpha/beta superfamily hydrolase